MNLSELPQDEQFKIELEREAAFLIWRYNRFEVKRQQINEVIQSKPVEYQQYFKDSLNKFTEINKKALQEVNNKVL